MVTIESFADDASVIVKVERHPRGIAWSASFQVECECGNNVWIKELCRPAVAMAATAAQALEHLVQLCRGKTLVISRESREQFVPADLVSHVK